MIVAVMQREWDWGTKREGEGEVHKQREADNDRSEL